MPTVWVLAEDGVSGDCCLNYCVDGKKQITPDAQVEKPHQWHRWIYHSFIKHQIQKAEHVVERPDQPPLHVPGR